ncbi:hypothetical protein V8G54_009184 [Vigna mungo]|uniref:Uncharacterized protein n=1 Tax=Vigna mungo TaxID=3915 RepID=A0AAQ3S3J7_VIGMU
MISYKKFCRVNVNPLWTNITISQSVIKIRRNKVYHTIGIKLVKQIRTWSRIRSITTLMKMEVSHDKPVSRISCLDITKIFPKIPPSQAAFRSINTSQEIKLLQNLDNSFIISCLMYLHHSEHPSPN